MKTRIVELPSVEQIFKHPVNNAVRIWVIDMLQESIKRFIFMQIGIEEIDKGWLYGLQFCKQHM